ncbi:glycosyltransferase [bacterium]|nr:MAG: glycosyltransferase [bacterium]
MSALPSISVVIPTLNEGTRVGGLLDALKSQSYPAAEIFVCDGDSVDETGQMARERGALVLDCERGTSRQRNQGARHATGELLVFLDADDTPPPRFLEGVAKSYRRFPFAVACPWFTARDSGFIVRAIYVGFNLAFFLSQSTIRTGSGVCLICPREKFLRCGGFHEGMHLGEDIRLIRQLSPRYGFHRHLLIPLETSGRRFKNDGIWRLMGFYLLISPLTMLGLWKPLQKLHYKAAPYSLDEK